MLKLVLVAMFAFWASFVAGTCVPSATPDSAAQNAAQTEIGLFQSFLHQRLCERVAVKYQLAGDYAIIGDFDKAIGLAREVADADAGFDFPLDTPFPVGPFSPFKALANCPKFTPIADRVHTLSLLPMLLVSWS